MGGMFCTGIDVTASKKEDTQSEKALAAGLSQTLKEPMASESDSRSTEAVQGESGFLGTNTGQASEDTSVQDAPCEGSGEGKVQECDEDDVLNDVLGEPVKSGDLQAVSDVDMMPLDTSGTAVTEGGVAGVGEDQELSMECEPQGSTEGEVVAETLASLTADSVDEVRTSHVSPLTQDTQQEGLANQVGAVFWFGLLDQAFCRLGQLRKVSPLI